VCVVYIGKVFPPSDGTSLVFARGSTRRIVWSYDDDITALSRRIWSFESSDGKLDEIFAFVDTDGGVNILTSLFEVAIEKPATLVLRNINETYGGTYKFSLAPIAMVVLNLKLSFLLQVTVFRNLVSSAFFKIHFHQPFSA
jgi:hypothetical protein